VVESGFHEESIRLVAQGEVDASAIDSQVLEVAMSRDPSLTDQLRVIESLGPSTSQPVAVSKRVPADLRREVVQALISLADDTVIVLVSDHGILLGEHGWTGKISTALHPALTRVPLIVADPRRGPRAHTSDWYASTHDVAPTVLSMAGVPVPKRMEGVDLSRPLRGRKLPKRPHAFGGYSNSFFIRTVRWAMWADNRPSHFQLYDLRKDPGEFDNVAREHPKLIRELYAIVRNRSGGRLPYYDF
jgi:hypothetical protein